MMKVKTTLNYGISTQLLGKSLMPARDEVEDMCVNLLKMCEAFNGMKILGLEILSND